MSSRAAGFPVEPGWRLLLRDLGLDADRVLRRAGLPADLYARAHATLSTAEYFRLWRGLEAEAADPLLPLRLVESLQAETFVPPLFAALCSANMQQAAQRLATYKRLVAPMRLHIDHGGHGELRLSPQWLETSETAPAVLVVVELAFLVRLARMATREPVPALALVLPELPDPGQIGHYAEYFGVRPVAGDSPQLVLAGRDAQRPFLTENAAMWQIFEPELRRRLAALDASATLAQRVRSALLELLPAGQASVEAVAQRLLVSTRTLQRRLGEEGESLRSLVNRTREELARHYLTQTALSIKEIGFLLGFADANSFFRAFQGWTGQTPESLRRT